MNFINAKLCLALICFITWHVANIMHHFSFIRNPELVHLFVCVHIFFIPTYSFEHCSLLLLCATAFHHSLLPINIAAQVIAAL